MCFRQFSLRGLKKVKGELDAGPTGMEFETDGRIAPIVGKNGGKTVENAGKSTKFGPLMQH